MKKIKPKPFAIIAANKSMQKWEVMKLGDGEIVIVLAYKRILGTTNRQITVFPWQPYHGGIVGWFPIQWLKLRVFFNCL